MKQKKLEPLYDEQLITKNICNEDGIAVKAIDKVTSLYTKYKNDRVFTQGDAQVDIVNKWNENYKIYKLIRDPNAHNYKTGIAEVFIPLARKHVNMIESEASNALFTRDDYFSTYGVGDKRENQEDAVKAYKIIKSYSDTEEYVPEFELAVKQCLIYGFTCGEIVYVKEEYDHLRKVIVEVPQIANDGSPMVIDVNGKQIPQMRKEIKVVSEHLIISRPRIETRDVYRLFINHNSNNPLNEDIIYRDSISAQRLLMLADQGVYDSNAVQETIKSASTFDKTDTETSNPPTFLDSMKVKGDEINNRYEVLRFYGLFETGNKNNRRQEQYIIDIAERKHVLRVIKNPFYSQYKPFVECTYDTMLNEAYVDGIIDVEKSLQYEINDKENQSLDAVSFQLNSPWLKSKRSKIKNTEIAISRRRPNYIIETNEMDGLRKIEEPVNVAHISSEIQRLVNFADTSTGAVSILSGVPTGTQADRSGKSLGILASGGKSQFSKFIRKFERRFMTKSLSICWKMIQQFSNDIVPIEFVDSDNNKKFLNQSVAEVAGEFNIKVSAGSEYIKEQERLQSMMNLVAIANSNDAFMYAVNMPLLMKDIAKAMPYDMSNYIDPENVYAQQKQQIDQLSKMLQMFQEQAKGMGAEIQRLDGVVKQTDKANQANPSQADRIKSGKPPVDQTPNSGAM